MHRTPRPAMCCTLGEFTRIGTSECLAQKDQEVPIHKEPSSSNTPVKKRSVGRPRIFENVDATKLSELEYKRLVRCRTNRESARRVREAKLAQVSVFHKYGRNCSRLQQKARSTWFELTPMVCR